MLENLKKINDKLDNFEDFKKKLIELIRQGNYEKFKELIDNNNFEEDELVNEKKDLKKLMFRSSEVCHSDSSTKIEKLELSFNKDYSSIRNFNLISPNQKVVSNTDSTLGGINQEINNDTMKYSIVNNTKKKLPYLRLGVVVALSSLEIKRIFIDEMRR